MRLAVLPGDDIGPEITDAALKVLEAVDRRFGLKLQFDMHEVGMRAHRACGTTLPEKVLKAVREADGVVLGPGGMTEYPPLEEGGINIPGTIRKQLQLYANIRPARARAGIPSARSGLNCVIVRENTEGFYADRNMFKGDGEFMPTPDVAMSVRLITASASRRIAIRAFEVASARKGHVSVVGKRHVLKMSDGLFVSEVEAVAQQFPNVALREIDVDAMAAELYSRPEAFDVILTTNMFGDILSNLANALAGSLGLASALNVGEKHAAANAGHGSAPDIAGKGIANPAGLILSTALLLSWYGSSAHNALFTSAGAAIEAAVDDVLGKADLRTRDLGGVATTASFAASVSDAIRDDRMSSEQKSSKLAS
jgi:isocitrate/isopropylmalate dehydrogenase